MLENILHGKSHLPHEDEEEYFPKMKYNIIGFGFINLLVYHRGSMVDPCTRR